MAICNAPLGIWPIASEPLDGATGLGILAPLRGFGTQSTIEFRGEIFWAFETQATFAARESDTDQMLGVTDKVPEEKVWYECEFIDIIHGANILTLLMTTVGSVVVLAQQLVSNGEIFHKARVLVTGVALGETAKLRFYITCSDGSYRRRTLKIRGREI